VSDFTIPQTVQESHKINDWGQFASFLSRTSIVDYGIVSAVNGTRVDVQNITYPDNAALVTKDVELLFPSSGGLSIQYEVLAGDTVLLIGSRRYVKSLAAQTSPAQELTASGYDKACLKAIPISFISGNAKFTITEKNGMIQMQNSSYSLATLIQNLITAIENIQTIGSPGNHSLSPSTIQQFNQIGQQFQKLLY
jgi:hypothetical protein